MISTNESKAWIYLSPLAHVKQGVLDWAEDGQDEGEADDVVDGVGEGGEEEGLGEWEIYQGLALIGRDQSRLCSDWLDHDFADARYLMA